MANDWSSVDCNPEHGTEEESFSFDGKHSCKVVLRCAWADRIALAADVLNNNRLWPQAGVGTMASKVTIRPVPGQSTLTGTGDKRFVYEEALVTIVYDVASVGNLDSVPSGPNVGQLYSESIEQTIEAIELDPRTFSWGSAAGGAEMKTGPVRQMFGMNLRRTLYEVTTIPTALFTLPGTCNVAQYVSASLGFTFPAETLCLAPASIERTVKMDGTKTQTIVMKLGYKVNGWNKYWNKDKVGGPGYDEIWSNTHNAVYKNVPTADYSTLLY